VNKHKRKPTEKIIRKEKLEQKKESVYYFLFKMSKTRNKREKISFPLFLLLFYFIWELIAIFLWPVVLKRSFFMTFKMCNLINYERETLKVNRKHKKNLMEILYLEHEKNITQERQSKRFF
jgi:hypothetical protein